MRQPDGHPAAPHPLFPSLQSPQHHLASSSTPFAHPGFPPYRHPQPSSACWHLTLLPYLSSSSKSSDSHLLRAPLLSAVGPALLLTPSHSQAFLLQALPPTIPNAHLLLNPLPVIWMCTCSFLHSPLCRPWRQGRRTRVCVFLCVSTSLRTGVCQCAWEFRVLLPPP